jgi:hypothetical protein
MSPEGMVHALEAIHRLLRPGGSLIDIHPIPADALIEIHAGGRVVAAEPFPSQGHDDVRQADGALAQAVARRLFALEREDEFDFSIYGSSVAELSDFMAEAEAYDDSPVDETVAAQQAALGARMDAGTPGQAPRLSTANARASRSWRR